MLNPLINQGKSYFAGTDVEPQLQANIGAIVKTAVPVAGVNLVTSAFILVDVQDTKLSLPGDFIVPFDGLLQYIGSSAYFQINYTLSGLMNSTTPDITFAISLNGDILDASVQFIHFDSSYREVSGMCIALLNEGDQFGLYARTSTFNDTMEVQNVSLMAVKIFQ